MKNKEASKSKKTIIGTVVSDKMDKTVTVGWEVKKRHPMYRKFVKSRVKVKAHDEKNESTVGDLVKIIETRPVSKDKNWKVIEIIEKAQRG